MLNRGEATSLDNDKHAIRSMAYRWVQVELPNDRLTYVNYLDVLEALLGAVGDVTQTNHMFTAVLNQAIRLGKSSEWVSDELRFEALTVAVSRSELIRLSLEHGGGVNDAALDLYNERLVRFT